MENCLPSGGFVDATGHFGFERVGMTLPLTRVSDVYKQNEESKIYEAYRKPWKNAKNDPGSLVYGKQRQERKRGHWGYTPMETGSYVFVLMLEGAGAQVLGVGWYGPKAVVWFKGLSTSMGAKAELKYQLDVSNNRLWFRSIHSLLECKRIEVHVTLDVLQPLYFFPCFHTTPIFKMFNTGAFAEHQLVQTTQWTMSKWQSEGVEKEKRSLGNELYDMREKTGDLVLRMSNQEEIVVHKAVLLAKSQYFKTCQLSDFQESKTMLSATSVMGHAGAWRQLVCYLYTGQWLENDTDFDLLIVCELVDFYGFDERTKQDAIASFRVCLGNLVAASIYAWNNRNTDVLEKVIMFWCDNEDVFVQKRHAEMFAASYNLFLSHNVEFKKALLRQRFDWNGQVTEAVWNHTMMEWLERRNELPANKRPCLAC